jgi:hypothetical protein
MRHLFSQCISHFWSTWVICFKLTQELCISTYYAFVVFFCLLTWKLKLYFRYCCGKGCKRRYHPTCLDPPLKSLPIGFWHCIRCVKKKLELGVHSVSEGVESIWDSREVVSKDEGMVCKNFPTSPKFYYFFHV